MDDERDERRGRLIGNIERLVVIFFLVRSREMFVVAVVVVRGRNRG